jgi:hypothetical protein
MPIEIDPKLKSTLIIYTIIIAIVLIQRPKLLFNDNMDLKILVLSKDKKYSVPLLYVVIIVAALLSYYITRV